MRYLVGLLGVMIACGGAKPAPAPGPAAQPPVADPNARVTLSFEDKTSAGRETLLKTSAERHVAVLTAAAGASQFEVHVSLKKAAQTESIACGIGVAIITRPKQDLIAEVSGDAVVQGTDDTALADCIEGLVTNLFETRGAAALRAAGAQ